MTASVSSRLLAVLRTFSHRTPLQTLSEISRRSGLPLTTTHRLVRELLQGGALERDDDGRYRIGLWLWEIAALAPRGLGLREFAMPFLEDVSRGDPAARRSSPYWTDATPCSWNGSRAAAPCMCSPGSRPHLGREDETAHQQYDDVQEWTG